MVEVAVELTESGIRAVDAAKTSITIGTDDWSPDATPVPLSSDVETTTAGYTTELRFPMAFVRVTDAMTGAEVLSFSNDQGSFDLSDSEYLFTIHSNIRTYVQCRGPVTVAKPNHEEVVISFPEKRAVTIGFESRLESPPETITVPGTPEGLAEALSLLPSTHRTSTADRSFPTMRGHPPRLELGDALDVPEGIASRAPDPDIDFVLPPSFEYLFPAAPLSYYLGATVHLERNARPRIEVPDRVHEFSYHPDFQQETASLLRRVFLLDCLVRNAGPHGVALNERRYLDALGLDAEALYGEAVPVRLAAYLDAPFETVSDALPEWHLSMSVDPRPEHVETLPYLLSSLANIVLPKSRPLDRQERLSRSLSEFYRASTADVPTVDMVEPTLGPGEFHGWIAPETPIDVFKALPEAYENRFKYRERASGPLSIVAVLNESEMAAEHTEAARIYRERATDLDIDIAVRERLTCDELAEVFESNNDLVHYIGHCEAEGLRCADGHLSISSLSESNAQVFFLNACGSYQEGLDLVRKGSVAGAVTFNKVLDEQAARVGTMFARLLVNGLSIEQAMQLARRRIMMGKDYAVVGDGTHVLAQSSSYLPAIAELEPRGGDTYRLKFRVSVPWMNGGHFIPNAPGNDEWFLFGSTPSFDLTRGEVHSMLQRSSIPVIFDGDIQWTDDLVERFA